MNSLPIVVANLGRYLDRLANDPSGMVMVALAVGAFALFIITRGKWR